MVGWKVGGGVRTPRMPQDLMEWFLASRALTNSGSFWATPPGGFLPKKAPRFFCFSGVLGGYLGCRLRTNVYQA